MDKLNERRPIRGGVNYDEDNVCIYSVGSPLRYISYKSK